MHSQPDPHTPHNAPGQPQQPYGQQHGQPSQPHDQPGQPYGYQPQGHSGEPPKTPGMVVAARVLMTVAGVIALLLGGIFGLVLAVPEAMEGVADGAASQGIPMDVAQGLFVVLVAVNLVYAVVSLTLAVLLGRRSPGLYWTAVAFQGLVLVLWLVNLVSGGVASLIPLLYTALIVGLLLAPASRAYYRR